MTPTDRKYSREHEWAKIDKEGLVVIGITMFAQEQLGDIVYIDLAPTGSIVEQFSKLGEIESVKAVSEIYSPISGKVIDVNPDVLDHPEVVNEDPYENGWLIRLKPNKFESESGSLLSMEEYEAFLAEAR